MARYFIQSSNINPISWTGEKSIENRRRRGAGETGASGNGDGESRVKRWGPAHPHRRTANRKLKENKFAKQKMPITTIIIAVFLPFFFL